MPSYRRRLHDVLSPRELRLFARLDTPQKIQTFLDRLPVNFSLNGDTAMSPRRVLEARMAHCAEAAVFAAAALAYHGRPPLLMDIRALPRDQDHIVTLFRERGLWGAISKTNHAVLRWRDPIYRSVRELAMSYAHEYCLPGGKKSMLSYSKPFSLARYAPKTGSSRRRISTSCWSISTRRRIFPSRRRTRCANAAASPVSSCSRRTWSSGRSRRRRKRKSGRRGGDHSHSSWPGIAVRRTACFRTPMSRPSTSRSAAQPKDVDARQKAGHDEGETARLRHHPCPL